MRLTSRSSHRRRCRTPSIGSGSSRPIPSDRRRARRISSSDIAFADIGPAISSGSMRSLDVEEDYLYAYGFLSRPVWQLLHPRKTPPLRALEKKVLETVSTLGEAHPRALESHLGKRRIVNAWGGYSKATTNALEWLHWRGLLRIARRENGIRVYHPASLPDGASPSADRLRALIMVYARIFAPSPEKSLQSVIARHRELGSTRQTLDRDDPRRRASAGHRRRRQLRVARRSERRAARRLAWCVFLRRSTRSSGTGRGSSICGNGRTGSRHIHRSRSVCAATTPCRCCGAIGSSAGRMRMRQACRAVAAKRRRRESSM